MFIHLCRKREIQSVSGGGAEKERETQKLKQLQAQSCQHRAQWGAQTHEPWDHDLSWSRMLNWLSHPGAPFVCFLNSTWVKSNGICLFLTDLFHLALYPLDLLKSNFLLKDWATLAKTAEQWVGCFMKLSFHRNTKWVRKNYQNQLILELIRTD